MSRRPCIHIGMPKTATTTLQYAYFPEHAEIDYVGLPPRDDDPHNADIQALMRMITQCDGVEYDAAEAKALFDKTIAPRLAGERLVVLSDETLTGSERADRTLMAQRLKALFGEATILVTLRNQLDAVKALYTILQKSYTKFQKFDDWLAESYENYWLGYFPFLDYAKILDLYGREFGRENLRILIFEDFLASREGFLKELCEAIGVDPGRAAYDGGTLPHFNERKSAMLMAYLRIRSAFMPNVALSDYVPRAALVPVLNLLRRGRRFEVELPASWAGRVADLYRAGNRRLMSEYGLPVDRHGYPV